MIRSFVALHVADSALAEKLLSTRDALRSVRGVKWVAPDQLHFTLKFLGSIEEARVPAAREALRTAAREVPPFEFALEGVGVFPPRGPARTFWAGVTAGKDDLAALGKAVEAAFSKEGFPAEERPFSPHLTLARVKDPGAGREVARALPALGTRRFGDARAEEIVLFSSDLLPSGPIHRPLERARLGRTPG